MSEIPTLRLSGFSLESFEFDPCEQPGAPAIIRLTAIVPPAKVKTEAAPRLMIETQDGRHRLAPLPGWRSVDGLVRLSYTAPADLLADQLAAYSLELPDDSVFDLSRPVRAVSPARMYTWRLRERMAERGMFLTTALAPRLAERGVPLSSAQVYRLVVRTPERLNLSVLAALCDILECTPNDLIECAPAAARE